MSNARWFGFNPPFFGGPEKVMSRQEDEKLIQNDILQLLLTVPGERVMRPTFGVELRTAVFDMNDDITVDNLKASIMTAIANEEPRVNLLVLELTRVPNQNKINIYLSAQVKNDPTTVINIERTLDLQILE